MLDFDSDDAVKCSKTVGELGEHTKVVCTRKTKNGYHILVKPFDRRVLNEFKHKEDFTLQTDSLLFVEYVVNELEATQSGGVKE